MDKETIEQIKQEILQEAKQEINNKNDLILQELKKQSKITKKQIMSVHDTIERQKLIAENIELFRK